MDFREAQVPTKKKAAWIVRPQPVNHMRGIPEAYMWRTTTDQIELMNIGERTSLSYSPRVGGKEKGL